MSEKERLHAVRIQKRSLFLPEENDLWTQSLKTRETTTVTKQLQFHCYQGGTHQKAWDEVWAGALRIHSQASWCCSSTAFVGMGRTRNYHHHV